MSLEILTSNILSPIRHGFFTRKGGKSSGIYSGLNCGQGSNDQADAVLLNRAKVADAMGVMPQNLWSLHQIHSAEVSVITETSANDRPMADAMVTRTPGMALGVLSADCQPVLFADPVHHVIGAAHAGWKGALTGVLEATVNAMIELGAERKNISATIGPCISQASYEVGPEFRSRFMDIDKCLDRYFIPSEKDRFLFDLAGFGLSRLAAANIKSCDWTGHCTYLDADRFYSYRRTTHRKEPDYGRLISAISLDV